MTYVKADRADFFEAFDKESITPRLYDIDNCDLVSSQDGLLLQKKCSTFGRWVSFGVSFDAQTNTRAIHEVAKRTLNLVKTSSENTPEERILSTCKSASRTCLLLGLKEKNPELYELGKQFLNHEASKLKQHPIFVACQNETLHIALDMLKENPESISVALGHYTQLLKIAYQQNEYRLCRQFIQLGADPKEAFGDFAQQYASTLLVDAIKDGQEKVAITLVQLGADLHIARDGKYPLHFAAKLGFCRLAEIMIQKGANVREVDNDLNSALHEACLAHQAEMALLLARNGANVAQRNNKLECAFRLAEGIGDREKAADFYSVVLSKHQPNKDLLVEGGISAFLQDCAESPAKLIRGLSGPNPFELALLFQDSHLAKSIALKMTLGRFYEYIKKLKHVYPNCEMTAVEFCFLTLSAHHLERPIPQLETQHPSREVALDELTSLIDGPIEINDRELSVKEATQYIRALIGRIQRKDKMQALLTEETELNKFYMLLGDLCLKNILIAVQDSDADEIQRHSIIKELVELELGEHCAGRFFGIITKLFRRVCVNSNDKTFEDEIAILLAFHREIILEHCVDPLKSNNQNDYNNLLALLGKKLNIPGHETTQYYNDVNGHSSPELAEQQFNKLYNVASIINDCIKPALEHSSELREKFTEWMLLKMPKDWADGLKQRLVIETSKQISTPAHTRDFLRRNGVAIDDSSTEYMQAFETARKKAYLEQEVFEHGSIRPIALCRMLAWLESPVVESEQLALESSPNTFACDAWNNIFDSVRK